MLKIKDNSKYTAIIAINYLKRKHLHNPLVTELYISKLCPIFGVQFTNITFDIKSKSLNICPISIELCPNI